MALVARFPCHKETRELKVSQVNCCLDLVPCAEVIQPAADPQVSGLATMETYLPLFGRVYECHSMVGTVALQEVRGAAARRAHAVVAPAGERQGEVRTLGLRKALLALLLCVLRSCERASAPGALRRRSESCQAIMARVTLSHRCNSPAMAGK